MDGTIQDLAPDGEARPGDRFAPHPEAGKFVDTAFDVPELGLAEPLLANVYCQLFAYHVARDLGRSIDKPRNLAKSVTVE